MIASGRSNPTSEDAKREDDNAKHETETGQAGQRKQAGKTSGQAHEGTTRTDRMRQEGMRRRSASDEARVAF